MFFLTQRYWCTSPEHRADTSDRLTPDGCKVTAQDEALLACPNADPPHETYQALLINRASSHSQFLFLFCLAFLLNEGKQLRRGGQEAREWNAGSLVPCHQLLPPSSEWGCRSSADGCPKGPRRQVICWEVTTFPQHGCGHLFLAHSADRGHKWWVPFSLWTYGEPGPLYYGFS